MELSNTSRETGRKITVIALGALLAIVAGCGDSGVPASKSEMPSTASGSPAVQPAPQADVQAQAPQVPQAVPPSNQAAPVESRSAETPSVTPEVQKAPSPPQPVHHQRAHQQLPAPEPQPTHAQSAPATMDATLPAGTTLTGTLQASVSTAESQVGQKVTLRVEEPVRDGERTAIPAGSTVQGTVSHVASAGRISGASELTLQFDSVVLPTGKTVPLASDPVTMRHGGDGKKSVAEIGAGAAVGSVLGHVLGGKRSTVKGAAIGAAVGTGVAMTQKGEQIVLPAGSSVSLTLSAPLVIATGSTL
jgi:hypothetical protein